MSSTAITASPVGIGFQMTEYSVLETEDYGFVCAVVQSGDVAGRELEIDYLVEDSSTCLCVCVCVNVAE